MKDSTSSQNLPRQNWQEPLDLALYDQNPQLHPPERAAIEDLLKRVDGGKRYWFPKTSQRLQRLVQALRDLFQLTGADRYVRNGVTLLLFREMHRRRLTFWAWSQENWAETICHVNVMEQPRFRIHLPESFFRGCDLSHS